MNVSPAPESSLSETTTPQAKADSPRQSTSDINFTPATVLPSAAPHSDHNANGQSSNATEDTVQIHAAHPSSNGYSVIYCHSPAIPPPAPRLNDLDDWPDSGDGPNYDIVAEDSLDGIGEQGHEDSHASTVEPIEDASVVNILDGLDCAAYGSEAEVEAGGRHEGEGREREVKKKEGKENKKGKGGDKGKGQEKKKHAPREYQTVSLDDLPIDVWDMPSPWSAYVTRNIYNTRSLGAFRTGKNQGNKREVSYMRGTIDDREIRFIARKWPQGALDGFLREFWIYRSPQYLLPLEGEVVQCLLGMFVDRPQAISLVLELPCLGGWQHAHTGMPHIDKEECMIALESIHKRGVLHGNLKLHHILRCRDMRMVFVGFAHARALVPMPQYGIERATEADLVLEKRKLAYLLDFDNARANEEKRTREAGPSLPPPGTPPVDRETALVTPFSESELAAWRKEADATNDVTFIVTEGDKCDTAEIGARLDSFDECLASRRQALRNNTRYLAHRAMPTDFRHASEVSATRNSLYYVLPELIAPLPLPLPTQTDSSSLGPPAANDPSAGSSQAGPSAASDSNTDATPSTRKPSPAEFFNYRVVQGTTPSYITKLLAAPDDMFNGLSECLGMQTRERMHEQDLQRAYALGLRFVKRRSKRHPAAQGLGRPMRVKLGYDYAVHRQKMQEIRAAYHKMLKDGKRLVHGGDRPNVTDGPPILRRHEMKERKEGLAHMYQPPASPGVPARSILRRPLYRPCVDQRALEAMNVDDGDETERMDVDGYPSTGFVDVADGDAAPGRSGQSEVGTSLKIIGKRKRRDDDESTDAPPAKRARTGPPQQKTRTRSRTPPPRPRDRDAPTSFVVDDPTRSPEETRRLLAMVDQHILQSRDSLSMLQDVRDRLSAQVERDTTCIDMWDVLASLIFLN